MASKTPSNKTGKSSKTGKRVVRPKKASPWPWLIGLGVVLLIALPIIVNAVRAGNLPGERFRSQGNVHIQEGVSHPDYNSDPPTSGWHLPNIASWGSHAEVLPDELLVHNMEDGGVILWYPLGTEEENAENIEALEGVARGYHNVVIAPREGLESPYVATAWTRLERFESLDEAGMRAFLEAFEGLDHHVPGVG